MTQQPLTITILTDTHYYCKDNGTSGKAYDIANSKSQKLLADSPEVLESAFTQIAEDNDSKIVIISGDLTNNGELNAHAEFIDMLRELKNKGKRVYVITATHDFRQNEVADLYVGDEKLQTRAASREMLFDMYREFGPDDAISVHRQSMSYVVQLCDGYRLFALNDDRNHKGASGFSDDCFKWITEQIEDAKKNGQFIIPMTHHPMLSPSPFYKIIGGGNIMGEADRRIDEFTEMGLNYMFTGHTHMQDISYKYTDNGKVFYDITTAAAIGYPATFRQVIFLPAEGKIDVKSVDVQYDVDGRPLKEHLEDKFFGMIRRVVDAAGKDIPELARLATAFSVKEKLIYKIGWIIKPFAKILGKLKIGTIAKLVKKESGLKKNDYAHIKDQKVVDFIVSLVRNLYGGDSPYSPDTAEYKITMGILAIIDDLLRLFKVNIGKLVKGATSVQNLVEPLLYNPGICDEKAVLNLFDDLPPVPGENAGFVRSRKGLPIVILLVLLVLTFLPVILLWLGFGFVINQIKYGKLMK